MDYELIEDITQADVAVRVKGSTLSEIFYKGAYALLSEMVENPEDISPLVIREGVMTGLSPDLLYVGFLNEILFFKDAEGLLLLPETVAVTEGSGECQCMYKLAGEKIIRGKHQFRVDVKAVTMHGLRIYSDGESFIAESVFDV